MIKKVIFDLDNTLMMFDDKYITYYQNILEKNGYSFLYQDAYNLFKSIGNYEKYGTIYDKKILLDFINKELFYINY